MDVFLKYFVFALQRCKKNVIIVYIAFWEETVSVYRNGAQKDIAQISAAISVRDAFAAPSDISYIPTDPAQLLIDERKLHMLSYFTGADAEKLSDYERFFEFVSNLDAMQGSAEKEIFAEEIKSLYSEGSLKYITDPRALWENLCKEMSIENYNFAEKIKTISHYDKIKNIRIFTNIDNFENYADFVSNELEKIKNSEDAYVTADISVLNFSRTDAFHATEAYRKYKAGDRADLDIALSGALYPVMSAIRSAGKMLLLNIGDNYTAAERMIEYFRARAIMPNAVIFARREARRVAEQLCGVYKDANGELLLSAGLLYYDGDTVRDIKNRFLDIAAAYPIDRLFVGGAATTSVLVTPRHSVLKRGIAEGIYELCEDMNECLKLAENI